MKNRKIVLTVISFCILLCAGYFVFAGLKNMNRKVKLNEDIERVVSSEDRGIFLTMFPKENIYQEDFLTYRGVETVFGEYRIENMEELGAYLRKIPESDGKEVVFLRPEPYRLMKEAGGKPEEYEQVLHEKFGKFIQEAEEIQYEVWLPNPSLEYWKKMNEKERNRMLESYGEFVRILSEYSNVHLFFMGGEQWLIENTANYTDEKYITNREVMSSAMRMVFCDYLYMVNPESMELILTNLNNYIEIEKMSGHQYPDLSKYCIVFFGDSVLANFPGSTSVAGVVEGLSKAETRNYAVGGSSGVYGGKGDKSFCDRVEFFLGEGNFPKGKKPVFVIEYGLNDYFCGVKVKPSAGEKGKGTYKGGLTDGVEMLRNSYPDAQIVILSPTYTSFFEGGEQVQGEQGGKLTDYVEAAKECSKEQGVDYIDNYHDLGINSETVSVLTHDGCHPNEMGRMMMAKSIINEIYVTNSR